MIKKASSIESDIKLPPDKHLFDDPDEQQDLLSRVKLLCERIKHLVFHPRDLLIDVISTLESTDTLPSFGSVELAWNTTQSSG